MQGLRRGEIAMGRLVLVCAVSLAWASGCTRGPVPEAKPEQRLAADLIDRWFCHAREEPSMSEMWSDLLPLLLAMLISPTPGGSSLQVKKRWSGLRGSTATCADRAFASE